MRRSLMVSLSPERFKNEAVRKMMEVSLEGTLERLGYFAIYTDPWVYEDAWVTEDGIEIAERYVKWGYGQKG